ncbi:CPBP family intramembrane glutamic endopeptidase [Desulfuribacillus alkaliarsenatis]|uniref:CPBP family intramembrane glutamic endopeptidase n=1 Tax=Desulfuribacillus alkaliarsenatis TaxID=766136 RepID=UPI000A02B4A8|nr:type II CAAX endopeptidase family protein [Desulfuribacillus alkaliarsenatis]
MTNLDLEEQAKKELVDNEQAEQLLNKKDTDRTDRLIGWPQFLIFIGIYLGISFTIGIVVGIIGASNNIDVEQIFTGYQAGIIEFVVIMMALLFYKKIRRFVWESFSFSPLKEKKTYGYMFVGFLIFYLTQYILIELIAIEDASNQPADLGFNNLPGFSLEYILFFVSIALLVPLYEEVLYRGVLHRFLEVRYNFWVGITISSLVFGLLHIGFPISATIMGIVMVVLFKLTKSIIPSILLHILWNTFAVIVWSTM